MTLKIQRVILCELSPPTRGAVDSESFSPTWLPVPWVKDCIRAFQKSRLFYVYIQPDFRQGSVRLQRGSYEKTVLREAAVALIMVGQ